MSPLRLSLAFVLVLAGCGSCGSAAGEDATAKANVELSKLSRCLLGDTLGAGERPSARLRYVQLAAQGRQDVHDWPERCAPHAEHLGNELRDVAGDDPKLQAVLTATRRTQRLLDQSRVPTDLDALFDAALAAGMVAVATEEGAAPPAPVHPLRAGDLPVLVPAPAMLAASDSVTGPVTHLAFADPNGPWTMCTLTHDLSAAACRNIQGVRGRNEAAIVPSAPGAPPHLLIKRGPGAE